MTPGQPLDPFSNWGPFRFDIPDDLPDNLRARLEHRAIAEGRRTLSGRPDIGMLLDAQLIEIAAGPITMRHVDAVITDPTDPDLARLMQWTLHSLLIREGRPDLADDLLRRI